MMNRYIKPNITFQSLNMATTVSAGCSLNATQAERMCPAEIPGNPGLTVFPEDSECVMYSPDMNDTICYHVPMADINVFES